MCMKSRHRVGQQTHHVPHNPRHLGLRGGKKKKKKGTNETSVQSVQKCRFSLWPPSYINSVRVLKLYNSEDTDNTLNLLATLLIVVVVVIRGGNIKSVWGQEAREEKMKTINKNQYCNTGKLNLMRTLNNKTANKNNAALKTTSTVSK